MVRSLSTQINLILETHASVVSPRFADLARDLLDEHGFVDLTLSCVGILVPGLTSFIGVHSQSVSSQSILRRRNRNSNRLQVKVLDKIHVRISTKIGVRV